MRCPATKGRESEQFSASKGALRIRKDEQDREERVMRLAVHRIDLGPDDALPDDR
jgi:hypothetical protein